MSLPNDLNLSKFVDGYGIQKLIQLIQTSFNALPTFWIGTQDEYDEIETKDENTLYFIKED